MYKKRKLIVHKSYQLKKAIIAGLSLLIISGTVTSAITFLSCQNNSTLTIINNRLDNSGTEMKTASDSNVLILAEAQRVRTNGYAIIVISIVFAFALSLGAFFYTIKHTSGVSGQMILLGNYLDLLNEGIKPEIRPLRKSDSFHDVFEKLAVYLKNRP